MNKNTEKWNKTGLLDGLNNEIDKTLLADNLEDAIGELIKKSTENDKTKEIKAGIFLPVIVRLFCEKNLRIIDDMKSLYKKFSDYFDKHYQLYLDLNQGPSYDGEAEFVDVYIKDYENL